MILAMDPGAARMGWAILDGAGGADPPVYYNSGVWEVPRGTMPYHAYRLHLIDQWIENASSLIGFYEPDLIVNETLPVRGFNNMSQVILAQTAITTVQALACLLEIPVQQIAANTVKVKIGQSVKASKVAVRNGVQQLFPQLKTKPWTKVFDESDACAIGLAYLGYDLRTPN